MIISRKEFHQRLSLALMNPYKTTEQFLLVKDLYKEIQADAKFRNHTYLFTTKNFARLPLQEESVGIKKKYPRIKTEGQRMAYISDELIRDEYEPVKVIRDEDYPNVIYVEDGFHRIFMANKLKMETIRCSIKYGKFSLPQTINFEQLISLIDMLSGILGQEMKLKDIHKMLLRGKKNKSEMMRANICFGKDQNV